MEGGGCRRNRLGEGEEKGVRCREERSEGMVEIGVEEAEAGELDGWDGGGEGGEGLSGYSLLKSQ